jgi:hypothetical protein
MAPRFRRRKMTAGDDKKEMGASPTSSFRTARSADPESFAMGTKEA